MMYDSRGQYRFDIRRYSLREIAFRGVRISARNTPLPVGGNDEFRKDTLPASNERLPSSCGIGNIENEVRGSFWYPRDAIGRFILYKILDFFDVAFGFRGVWSNGGGVTKMVGVGGGWSI